MLEGRPFLGLTVVDRRSAASVCWTGRTRTVGVEILDDVREGLARLLMQVADSDTSGEDSIVLVMRNGGVSCQSCVVVQPQVAYRVTRSHRGGSLSSEVVQLDGSDTLVDSSNDTLGDLVMNQCQLPATPATGGTTRLTSIGSRWFTSSP